MQTGESSPSIVSLPDSKTWMSDPEFYASADVHSAWFTVRNERSGYLESFSSAGGRYHSFYGYAECNTILRDDELFTSRYGTIIESIDYPDTARDITMTVSDGEIHDNHRGPANRCLSKTSIQRQADTIRSEVRKIVAEIPEGDDIDLCEHTKGLPMALFGPLLPVERDQWTELSDLVFMSILPDDPGFANGLRPEIARRVAHAGIFASLSDAVDVQRRHPGPGVLGEYLSASDIEAHGDPVESILANSYSLLMGAHATTNQVANHLVDRFIDRTDLLGAVSGGAVTLPSLINEAVRWVTPTNHLLRRAVCDTELGGVPVGEGEWVVAWVGSANRDESVVSEPYRFDPLRRGKHLGFGIGSHYCIGSHIAAFGLAYFFELLLQEFDLGPSSTESQHVRSNWINGYSRLPLQARRKRRADG